MKSFFYHYNKPESLRRQRPVISVHYNNACHLVDGLQVSVPTQSKIRKRQPHFVMTGKCHSFEIINGQGVIA